MSRRLLRRKAVLQIVPFGKTKLYDLISQGLFPAPVPLAPDGIAVGWIEDEVYGYVDQRIAAARNSASSK